MSSAEERYWAKVDVRGPDDCWEWTAAKEKGHGRFTPRTKVNIQAHRFGWYLHSGEWPPKGLVVRHRCDNPACQNPAHLELGTQADNMRDMVKRGRSNHGERHHSAKLTEEQALEVIALADAGFLHREIAARFGVSRQHIGLIVGGGRWKHLQKKASNNLQA